jgi:leucyl aminopeptidase
LWDCVPLVENMIDAKATRPGDVITCYNKKTVEIVDTDAEGRLIMADCLAYSEKYKPSAVFDIATLTGDAAYMFGGKSSLVIGNNNELVQKIIQYGKENNEKIWEMPLWQEYIDLTQSNIADYKNYSYDAQAGAIMAGAFLSNFVPEKCKWIHLDIAGVDNLSQDSNTRSSGSSGEILRTLFTYVQKNT